MSKKQTAAERAAIERAEYLEDLKSQWKIPLSAEQYAGIRHALTPYLRARAERGAA